MKTGNWIYNSIWLASLGGVLIAFFLALSKSPNLSLTQLNEEFERSLTERHNILKSIGNQWMQLAVQELETEIEGTLWNSPSWHHAFDEPYILLLFRDDSLYFWNKAEASVFENLDFEQTEGLLKNDFGLFLLNSFTNDQIRILLLEPVYYQFPIQNNYLKRGFVNRFQKYNGKIQIINNIDSDLEVQTLHWGGLSLPIARATPNGVMQEPQKVSLIGMHLSLLLVLMMLSPKTWLRRKIYFRSLNLRVLKISQFLFFGLMLFIGFSRILKLTDAGLSIDLNFFFQQLPLLISLLFYLLMQRTATRLNAAKPELSNVGTYSLLLGVFLVLAPLAGEYLFLNLNQNNQFFAPLDFSKTFRDIDWQGMIASAIIISSMIAALGSVLGSTHFQNLDHRSWLLLSLCVGVSAVISSVFSGHFFFTPVLLAMVILSIGLIRYIKGESVSTRKLHVILWLSLSIAYAAFVSVEINRMDEEEQILTAKKLSAEKDPMLEFLFESFKEKALADTTLTRLIYWDNKDDQEINGYLREKYFQGYLSKFETEVTTCFEHQQLVLQPENYMANCIDYFRSLVSARGDSLIQNSIYLIDNNLLGIHYVGYLLLHNPENRDEPPIHMFIEFFFKYIPEGTGYPFLLVDEAKGFGPNLSKYSFASYRSGVLYYKFGSYFFPTRLDQMTQVKDGFFSAGGYRHAILAYGDKTLIISRKYKSWAELMAPYSFLMLINGLLLILLNAIQYGLSDFRKSFTTFRTRLQLILSISLLVSFTLIGLFSTLYLAEIYRKKKRRLPGRKDPIAHRRA